MGGIELGLDCRSKARIFPNASLPRPSDAHRRSGSGDCSHHSEGTPAGLEVGENRASLVPEEAEFLNLTALPDPGVQRGSGPGQAEDWRPLPKD